MATATDPALPSPLAPTLERFFETKSACDIDGTMSYFSPALASYIDATLGLGPRRLRQARRRVRPVHAELGAAARSYATQILSNEVSALVRMVDTPELFGGELRILAAIDLADGKIVRWVDYWDSSAYSSDLYARFRTPADAFPTDLKDGEVPTRAAPGLVDTCTTLHGALAAGDAAGVHDLLHTDVVLADMALRTQVIGRIETVSYLDRVLGHLPYGRSSSLRHVVGGEGGGGFEWTAGDGIVGITEIVWRRRAHHRDQLGLRLAPARARPEVRTHRCRLPAVAGSGNPSPTGTPGIIRGIDHARSVEGA